MDTLPKNKNIDQEIDDALDFAENAERKDIKINISFRLDADIYDELKKKAADGEGSGRYQTLMNQLLRDSLFGNVEEMDTNKVVSFDELKALMGSALKAAVKAGRSQIRHPAQSHAGDLRKKLNLTQTLANRNTKHMSKTNRTIMFKKAK